MPHREMTLPPSKWGRATAADTTAELGCVDCSDQSARVSFDPSGRGSGARGIPAPPEMRSDRIGTGIESLPGSPDVLRRTVQTTRAVGTAFPR